MYEAVKWLADEIRLMLLSLVDSFMQGVASLLALIPMPNWALNLGSVVASIPESVWFYAKVLELPTGATIVAAALGIRFLIRRLPVVG